MTFRLFSSVAAAGCNRGLLERSKQMSTRPNSRDRKLTSGDILSPVKDAFLWLFVGKEGLEPPLPDSESSVLPIRRLPSIKQKLRAVQPAVEKIKLINLPHRFHRELHTRKDLHLLALLLLGVSCVFNEIGHSFRYHFLWWARLSLLGLFINVFSIYYFDDRV